MSSPPRVVSVFGATGTQGSAVVQGLLKDGTFVPRAITRNPESESSLELKALGAEVVKGNSEDKASLVQALRGSEAVFAVTVPVFLSQAGTDEITQGKNMIDAAKEAGVKFFIFSSLPSVLEISGGKYTKVVHYDQKAVVEGYLKASGLVNASIHTGAFLENYWKYGLLAKTESGYNVSLPVDPECGEAFTWISKDLSVAVLALLKNYDDPAKGINGKTYPLVNDCISWSDMVARTSKALGVEVTFTTVPPSGRPAWDEMYASHADYSGLYTATPVPNPDLVALGVKLGTIEEFLETEVKPRFGKSGSKA